MTTPRRVTCYLVNETTDPIGPTGKDLNYKVEQGKLAGSMPNSIAAGAREKFELVQDDGAAVGPSGWACYELQGKDLVYQIGFDDPSKGGSAYTIGLNFYKTKLGDGVTSVTYSGPSGALTADQVAGETNLTVEYHLGYKATAQPPADPNAAAVASKPVGGSPGGAATAVTPPYFARWNQAGITQKRKKVLAAIYKIYPLIWDDLGADAKAVAAANGGTGSTKGPWSTYANQGPWGGPGTSCTASCPMIGRVVSPKSATHWNFAAHAEKGGWVKWGTPDKKMPSVGDIYIMVRDEIVRPLPPEPKTPRPTKPKDDATPAEKAKYKADNAPWAQWDQKVALQNPHERHVGIILEVPSAPDKTAEIFITADGGQKAYAKEAAHLAKRSWLKTVPGPSDKQYLDTWKKYMESKDFAFAKPKDYAAESIYFVGGAESASTADGNRLVGWIDVDQVEFGDEEFDEKFTKADYEALGARIESVRATK